MNTKFEDTSAFNTAVGSPKHPAIPLERLQHALEMKLAGEPWKTVIAEVGFGFTAIRSQMQKAGMQFEFPPARTKRAGKVYEHKVMWDTGMANRFARRSLKVGS